jgi:2'-5' RNA ligase
MSGAAPRLFASIPVPEPTRRALAALPRRLSGARWAPVDQLHLTLRFFGPLAETEAEALEQGLAALEAPRLELRPTRLGSFPGRDGPSVLWLGLSRAPALIALQSAIEATARGLGLAPEVRAFVPHLTLARLKGTRASALAAWIEGIDVAALPGFEAEGFELVASTLHPSGAEHRLRRRYPSAAIDG